MPDPFAQAISERLQGLIRQEIAKKGPMPFARYMALALYAPGLGYYSAGARKFGEAGDFITAPEISPLFGETLARFCLPVLEKTGGDILELGAGSGALAASLLQALEAENALPSRYFILEVSAELRQRQEALLAKKLPRLKGRIVWLDTLPEDLEGVILANEVADALPVHRFTLTEGGIMEWAVDWEEGFTWRPTAPSKALEEAIAPLRLPEGYTSEVCLALKPWVQTLGKTLSQGAILILDYGYPRREYYHPERSMGTLMCHYRHRAHHDPLILPGLQDITAHVDFTAIAEGAVEAGLSVAGYTTQAHFLLDLGLLQRLESKCPGNIKEHMQLAQEVKRLILDMGERFKAIVLTRDISLPRCSRDLSNRL